MVVGFVNAGLLVLKQAISVVIGANIGTTCTAWLVSSMSVFKITQYALPIVGIGFAFMKIGKTRKMRFFGEVLLGFGILFLGLEFMKDAVIPLKQSQQVKNIFIMFSDKPVLGVLVGIFFTVILQSSSATIAIVQVLAFNGLISFPAAIPIVLGDNIGTTITAQLASVGTNLTARRAAMSHTLFNMIGVSYMLVLIYSGMLGRILDWAIPSARITAANIMVFIAIFHSSFNIFNAMIFLPLISWLEKMSIWLVPKRKGMVEVGTKYLEKHLLETPSIALEQARKEVDRMLDIALRAVGFSVKSFFENDIRIFKSIATMEQAVDTLQSEITQYLVELSQKELEPEQFEELPVLIHSVNDIERIGDHSENIKELVEQKVEDKMPFTDDAISELKEMWDELNKMGGEVRDALQRNEYDLARQALKRENRINQFQVALKKAHVRRLNEGKCTIKSGILFIDFVDNLEKIGDHLANIAQAVSGGMRWGGVKKGKTSVSSEHDAVLTQ
ncbi:MAG: Na/Pi cotransporter family protein, partial [Candidatus Omnitrophota bacterium]